MHRGTARRGRTSIAYETVQTPDGALPLLAPMSEVAGRLSAQVGAYHLMRTHGGRGVLMGGVPGVEPAAVVVIGAGTAGYNAARVAIGMGAAVTVLDVNIARLRELDRHVPRPGADPLLDRPRGRGAVKQADLVIGAVLVPGAQGSDAGLELPGEADEAGCGAGRHRHRPGRLLRGFRPTTHDDPTFAVHDTLFYCVANMPGAVPNTSTYALTNVTLPYAVELANHGWRDALRADPALAGGLNTHDGHVTNAPVAAAHGYDSISVADALA